MSYIQEFLLTEEARSLSALHKLKKIIIIREQFEVNARKLLKRIHQLPSISIEFKIWYFMLKIIIILLYQNSITIKIFVFISFIQVEKF